IDAHEIAPVGALSGHQPIGAVEIYLASAVRDGAADGAVPVGRVGQGEVGVARQQDLPMGRDLGATAAHAHEVAIGRLVGEQLPGVVVTVVVDVAITVAVGRNGATGGAVGVAAVVQHVLAGAGEQDLAHADVGASFAVVQAHEVTGGLVGEELPGVVVAVLVDVAITVAVVRQHTAQCANGVIVFVQDHLGLARAGDRKFRRRDGQRIGPTLHIHDVVAVGVVLLIRVSHVAGVTLAVRDAHIVGVGDRALDDGSHAVVMPRKDVGRDAALPAPELQPLPEIARSPVSGSIVEKIISRPIG
ncbi:hypothetical protein AC249_AIPGENE9899, partial [Exaiptasia diaphana]